MPDRPRFEPSLKQTSFFSPLFFAFQALVTSRLCHQYHFHQDKCCANMRPCPHNGSMPVAKPIGSEEGSLASAKAKVEEGALDHFL